VSPSAWNSGPKVTRAACPKVTLTAWPLQLLKFRNPTSLWSESHSHGLICA